MARVDHVTFAVEGDEYIRSLPVGGSPIVHTPDAPLNRTQMFHSPE